MSNSTEQGFDRAVDEAKRQASNVADAASVAAKKTATSFETAAREIIEPRLLASHLPSDGYLAGCIGPSNLLRPRMLPFGVSRPATLLPNRSERRQVVLAIANARIGTAMEE